MHLGRYTAYSVASLRDMLAVMEAIEEEMKKVKVYNEQNAVTFAK